MFNGQHNSGQTTENVEKTPRRYKAMFTNNPIDVANFRWALLLGPGGSNREIYYLDR